MQATAEVTWTLHDASGNEVDLSVLREVPELASRERGPLRKAHTCWLSRDYVRAEVLLGQLPSSPEVQRARWALLAATGDRSSQEKLLALAERGDHTAAQVLTAEGAESHDLLGDMIRSLVP